MNETKTNTGAGTMSEYMKEVMALVGGTFKCGKREYKIIAISDTMAGLEGKRGAIYGIMECLGLCDGGQRRPYGKFFAMSDNGTFLRGNSFMRVKNGELVVS